MASLSGSVSIGQSINLTTFGSADWAAFGYTANAASIERKSTGSSQISALSQVGSIALANYNNTAGSPTWLSNWTDGTPNGTVSGEGYLVFSSVASGQGPGPGMSFTVPADTTLRTLDVYVAVSNNTTTITQGKLTATLSDASAGPYSDTSVGTVATDTGLKLGHYTITYNAASSGQTLTVAWINNTAHNQNVQIYAATLALPAASGTPAISGTAQVGQVLTATGGTGSYQFYNEGAPISGATSSTYTLQGIDQGCLIQVLSGGVFSVKVGPVLGTTVRYVSMTDGLDTNDGTTSTAGAPHGPWKTLTHVNAQTLTTIPAGTSVLFKRGDTWRNDGCSTSSGTQLSPSVSGTAGSPIVFDAYGTGANPVFDGSYDLSTTGAWTQIAGLNVWQSVHQFNGFGHANGLPNNAADDPGNLIWGISPIGGHNVPPSLVNADYGIMAGTGTNNIWFAPGASQSGLMSSGQWNFNTDDNRIQVYCVGNPATFLSGVNNDLRAAIDTCLIYFNQQSYLTFQNLTLNYSGATAIDTGGAGGSCNNITIRDMVVQWIGGGNLSGDSSTDSRYADGYDIEGSAQNILIERIWWHQIYDTGPGPQCGGGPHQDNITIRNNVCTDCGAFFSTFFLGGTPTASGLSIYNNTVYCTQGCWSNFPAPGQRPNNPGPSYEENVFGLVVNTVTTTVVQSNMSIQNNIFAGIGGIGSSPGFGIVATRWNVTGVNASNPFTASGPGGTGPWLDYNCWPVNINGGGAQQIALSSGNYSMANWVQGTNIGGAGTFTPALEVHGIFNSDPLFTSQVGLDLSVQSGSPCLNAGANLYSSGVVWDFNKNPRPTSGAFTMGAFQ